MHTVMILLTRSVLVSVTSTYYFNHIDDTQTLCHRIEYLYIVKTAQQLKIDTPQSHHSIYAMKPLKSLRKFYRCFTILSSPAPFNCYLCNQTAF